MPEELPLHHAGPRTPKTLLLALSSREAKGGRLQRRNSSFEVLPLTVASSRPVRMEGGGGVESPLFLNGNCLPESCRKKVVEMGYVYLKRTTR